MMARQNKRSRSERGGSDMPSRFKVKEKSHGTVRVARLSPPLPDESNGINVHLSFEEALKLHMGLMQILGQLNRYDRRRGIPTVCLWATPNKRITLTEGPVHKKQEDGARSTT